MFPKYRAILNHFMVQTGCRLGERNHVFCGACLLYDETMRRPDYLIGALVSFFLAGVPVFLMVWMARDGGPSWWPLLLLPAVTFFLAGVVHLLLCHSSQNILVGWNEVPAQNEHGFSQIHMSEEADRERLRPFLEEEPELFFRGSFSPSERPSVTGSLGGRFQKNDRRAIVALTRDGISLFQTNSKASVVRYKSFRMDEISALETSEARGFLKNLVKSSQVSIRISQFESYLITLADPLWNQSLMNLRSKFLEEIRRRKRTDLRREMVSSRSLVADRSSLLEQVRLPLIMAGQGFLVLFGIAIAFYKPGIFGIREGQELRSLPRVEKAKKVPLNEMSELDGKTKAQIFDLRRNLMRKHAWLMPSQYEPSKHVFGLIEDGKAWWGIEGVYYHRRGPQNANGLSRESRYLNNPHLLLGVMSDLSWFSGPPKRDPLEFMIKPLELRWTEEKNWVYARYRVSEHFRFIKEKKYPSSQENRLRLQTYNARDFGFRFGSFREEETHGLALPEDAFSHVVTLRDFIHLGMSCSVPGGCNNTSPKMPDLRFVVKELPARFGFNLWRNRPESAQEMPDTVFVMDLE